MQQMTNVFFFVCLFTWHFKGKRHKLRHIFMISICCMPYFKWSLYTNRMDLLTQNLVQISRLMIPHTYTIKVWNHLSLIIRFSRESCMAPKEVCKWFQKAEKGIGLRFWSWLGDMPGVSSLCGLGLAWFQSSTNTKGGSTQILSPYPGVGQMGEEYWSLKVVSSSTTITEVDS